MIINKKTEPVSDEKVFKNKKKIIMTFEITYHVKMNSVQRHI